MIQGLGFYLSVHYLDSSSSRIWIHLSGSPDLQGRARLEGMVVPAAECCVPGKKLNVLWRRDCVLSTVAEFSFPGHYNTHPTLSLSANRLWSHGKL